MGLLRAGQAQLSISTWRINMGRKNRTVFKRSDGKWVNKRDEASKASSVHDTQSEAQAEAKQMLGNSGGGELTVMGLDGTIRSKDTIAPAKDPNPPRDKEH